MRIIQCHTVMFMYTAAYEKLDKELEMMHV